MNKTDSKVQIFIHCLGRYFLINCITNISHKKLGSAGGTKIKIKSVVPLRDEKRNLNFSVTLTELLTLCSN